MNHSKYWFLLILNLALLINSPRLLLSQSVSALVERYVSSGARASEYYLKYADAGFWDDFETAKQSLGNAITNLEEIQRRYPHFADSMGLSSEMESLSEIRDAPPDRFGPQSPAHPAARMLFLAGLQIKIKGLGTRLREAIPIEIEGEILLPSELPQNNSSPPSKKTIPKETGFRYTWNWGKDKSLVMTFFTSVEWNAFLSRKGLASTFTAIKVELKNSSRQDLSINPVSDYWTIITKSGTPFKNVNAPDYAVATAVEELPQAERQKLFSGNLDIFDGTNSYIIVLFPQEVGEVSNWKRVIFSSSFSVLGKVNLQQVGR